MRVLRKRMRFVYSLILGCTLYSCSTGSSTAVSYNSRVAIVNLDTVNENRVFRLSSLFLNLEVIPLENKDVLIGGINKMQTYGGHLFVLDFSISKGVYEFDRLGKFIRRFGNIGGAPGEYISCTDFTINERLEEIYIYDSSNKNINKYDILTGKYKNSVKLAHDIRRMIVNSGRLYAINTNYSLGKSDPFYILREIDITTGNKIGEWMNAEQYNKGWTDSFWSTNFFYNIGKDMDVLAFGLGDSIMCISDGELYPYITLKGNKISQKEDLLVEEIRPYADPYLKSNRGRELILQLMQNDKIVSVSNIVRHKEKIYFQCIGKSCYTVEYDQKNAKFLVYGLASEDDLLFAKSPDHCSVPVFLNSDENGAYYCVGIDYLPELKHFALEKGVISEQVINKEKLKELNEDSNPVILYYEFKK